MTDAEDFIEEFLVFPNPASDHIRIELETEGSMRLDIYSLAKVPVKSFDISGPKTLEFDISDLAQGYYLVSLRNQFSAHSVKFLKL